MLKILQVFMLICKTDYIFYGQNKLLVLKRHKKNLKPTRNLKFFTL